MTISHKALPSRALPVLVVLALFGVFAGSAQAAGSVSWKVLATAEPTNFAPGGSKACSREEEKCDRYQLEVLNSGDESSTPGLTLTERLPKGIVPEGIESGTDVEGEERNGEGNPWICPDHEVAPEEWVLTCTFAEAVPAGRYAPWLDIHVSAPAETATGSLKNTLEASKGGAVGVIATSVTTPISSAQPEFRLTHFAVEADEPGGEPDLQPGGHPWQLTTSFGVPMIATPPGVPDNEHKFGPAENVKKVVVELPLGFVGDPLATPARCTEKQLNEGEGACPESSRVGSIAFDGGAFPPGEFKFTGIHYGFIGVSNVFNMVPEAGYPAELAFSYAGQEIFVYASVVHGATGERLRVTAPALPSIIGVGYTALTIWGQPGASAHAGNGSETAFLTDPTNCEPSGGNARIELESWENPGHTVEAETSVFPQISGCNLLQSSFLPSLNVKPSTAAEGGTSQADEPSAYTAELSSKQSTGFNEPATPELKDATVTLPEGVSVNPAAGQGLQGCAETGPNGINVGSTDIGKQGEDLGDPEAAELGRGDASPGGNGSPYDDDVYHTAPGHCPEGSIIGSAEVTTPVLASPLTGHVYLAAPKCGGAGQPGCTNESAEDGQLFGLYLEVAGSGVIVKLPGTVSANAVTGRLTAHFVENPQLPFGSLKLHFEGGPRAPLANPQACGSFATSSVLTSWAGQEVANAAESFNVDWDGHGAACPAGLPFAPSFSAGTVTPAAGADSAFTLTFGRNDREQDLSGLSVTLPQGLLAHIAGVPLCGEAQANAGTCSAESKIGTVSALAGAGPDPLYVPGGNVYLTTGYRGQPFGLSIVVPAVAGPFNLGNVVVRAAIEINPSTSQVTVVSDPLPQLKDGVPFRLRTVNVEVNRAGFMFNPTSCAEQSVTATLTGSQGAAVPASSPFGVTGCGNLPFKPTLTASTQGKTSKAGGASLTVKVSQTSGEADIHRVDLTLPTQLPARLTTLQKACTEAQFNQNPGGCPAASFIGTGRAVTPVLPVPVEGPAILVSHGGAAFPDVEFVLQGDGVTIVLDGATQIKGKTTYSRFETVPDAPITSFETRLPEGPHSVLGTDLPVKARYSMCGQSLLVPTSLVAQDGASMSQSTKVSVSGCSAKKVVKKAKKKQRRTKSRRVGKGGRS